MFKDLTYKKKNQLLLAGGILFLLFAWFMAFKPTFSLYANCNALELQLSEVADAPIHTAMLQKKLTEMDQMLGNRQLTDTNTQQALLNLITHYCQSNKIVLREFPRTVTKQDNDYTVETNVFTVEGSFSKLLGLAYVLEQKERIGKVASVLFHTRKDVRTKVLSLTASIYIQNVKKNQHEQ